MYINSVSEQYLEPNPQVMLSQEVRTLHSISAANSAGTVLQLLLSRRLK